MNRWELAAAVLAVWAALLHLVIWVWARRTRRMAGPPAGHGRGRPDR